MLKKICAPRNYWLTFLHLNTTSTTLHQSILFIKKTRELRASFFGEASKNSDSSSFFAEASKISDAFSFWVKNGLEFFWRSSFFGLEFFENVQKISLKYTQSISERIALKLDQSLLIQYNERYDVTVTTQEIPNQTNCSFKAVLS